MRFFFLLFASLALLLAVNGECPNACSGHGDCGKFDMCDCYRNWQSSDCSERTCQFGLAHVDTPKGDMDMSGGALDAPTTDVISGSMVYPYGTTEQFPDMVDSADTVLDNSAHYYMECSNKGLCNRKDGECECFEGYEGSSCQRASCPNDCSGHGVCKNIRQIAEDDASNYYELWDKYATLGCVCDAGYYGADCSARRCKYGVDPLFIDDEANSRYAQYDIIMDGGAAVPSGTYAIVFYDVFGENWETEAITVSSDPCDDIIAALEGLPNNAIPTDSVTCTFAAATNVYTTNLQFMGNPGYLMPISINEHLSGGTATLTTSTVNIRSSGTRGEFTDNVPTHCEGITVTVAWATDVATMTIEDGASGNTAEVYKLKSCLGTSDYTDSTNVDVNNWDYGVDGWPHLVKMVEAGTTDGGYYNLLSYDNTGTSWDLLFDIPSDSSMEIFTTDATMELLYDDADGNDLQAATGEDAAAIQGDATGETTFQLDLDMSCESGSANDPSHCLQKGEIIMLGAAASVEDAVDGEFYTITRVWTVDAYDDDGTTAVGTSDQFFVSVDHAITGDFDNVYVLTVNDESYGYVSECSNRGLCNGEEGLCECFAGYTNDNCDTQSAIAV